MKYTTIRQHSSRIAAVALILMVMATPSSAITIITTFRNPGETLTGFGTATAAPSNAVGAGTLQSIFATAVDYWENVYLDSHTLTLQFGWFGLSGATGTHVLLTEGGTPHRETSGSIAFDSDLTTAWFLDPTPASHSEYTTFTNYTADLGGGTMNIGREYTGGTGNGASHDLFTTAVHEIGHALGLSSANNAFQAEAVDVDIDLTAPRAFPGAALPVVGSSSAHLNLDHPVMRPSRPSGVRRLLSDADILANAQISQFTQINLNPAIPEPATIVILAIGMLFSPRFRRSD